MKYIPSRRTLKVYVADGIANIIQFNGLNITMRRIVEVIFVLKNNSFYCMYNINITPTNNLSAKIFTCEQRPLNTIHLFTTATQWYPTVLNGHSRISTCVRRPLKNTPPVYNGHSRISTYLQRLLNNIHLCTTVTQRNQPVCNGHSTMQRQLKKIHLCTTAAQNTSD